MTTTTLMPRPTIPTKILEQLTELGHDAHNFVSDSDETADEFSHLCSQMQHFLDEVRKLMPQHATNGNHAANGGMVQDDPEVAMSNRKLLASISGTFAYLVADETSPDRVEVLSAELSAIRNGLQKTLDANRNRWPTTCITPDVAAQLEDEVEKRFYSAISIKPVTTPLRDLLRDDQDAA